MRVYEDDYAYEIEPIRDPATQLSIGWRYNVYRIRPDHKLLRSGQVSTQQEAETAGRKVLASVRKGDLAA
jgi:hypothetical protein